MGLSTGFTLATSFLSLPRSFLAFGSFGFGGFPSAAFCFGIWGGGAEGGVVMTGGEKGAGRGGDDRR